MGVYEALLIARHVEDHSALDIRRARKVLEEHGPDFKCSLSRLRAELAKRPY